MIFASLLLLANSANLLSNPGFDLASADGKSPLDYQLRGGAKWAFAGYADEIVTPGVALESSLKNGSVSAIVHVDQRAGKWVTFTFRGMAEDGFTVSGDRLAMKIDFYKSGTYIDSAERQVYREITRDRRDFAVNGSDHKSGAEVWRTYSFEELLPFPEVDSIRVSVLFENGSASTARHSAFFVDDFSLTQDTVSHEGKIEPTQAAGGQTTATDTKGMVALGGRWFYRPADGEKVELPLIVNTANADRLFYKDDCLSNPFANSMTAVLQPGMMDEQGAIVQKPRTITDNLVLVFGGGKTFTMRSRNIPNHPTARFPDTYGTQGYNPSYIQEQNDSWKIPIGPKLNPGARVLTVTNDDLALPMGTVGVAVNGVSFFNPFDAGMQDATGMMDRCCGHPNPGENRYHYHKYPICVNTPFVDKGEAHSPLIGFAFDGFPVYGPYEKEGELARDCKSNPLNGFNAHFDQERGWHYHVTPGKFPYILGGYMGFPEASDLNRPPMRRRG